MKSATVKRWSVFLAVTLMAAALGACGSAGSKENEASAEEKPEETAEETDEQRAEADSGQSDEGQGDAGQH